MEITFGAHRNDFSWAPWAWTREKRRGKKGFCVGWLWFWMDVTR